MTALAAEEQGVGLDKPPPALLNFIERKIGEIVGYDRDESDTKGYLE